ncbi:MAG: hypothetical protein HQM09_17430 [Candidatus Riflebacteria bacterium]|nr:hypothetical protein [Candidatus Riflebacteria bacterium]
MHSIPNSMEVIRKQNEICLFQAGQFDLGAKSIAPDIKFNTFSLILLSMYLILPISGQAEETFHIGSGSAPVIEENKGSDGKGADANDKNVWNDIRDIFHPVSPKGQAATKTSPLNSTTISTNATQTSKIGKSPPSLKGVMIGADKKGTAILGGKILREGDEIDGFLVKKISANSVTLIYEGENVVVYVRK